MPNRPTHLTASESFTFAQRESLEFELAMAGTGTLRGVLLAVKPDGQPLAIITSTQIHALARITRVDQRLLRIILQWPSWVESQAILHLLCAPTDEVDSFSSLNQLSLAHYSRPTSLHYQPELADYIGWRSLHLASWRIMEGEPQMKALAQPYDHALPAAARDFGFSAGDVASALVLPNIKSRRSQHANIGVQTALQENLLPLATARPSNAVSPKDIELTGVKKIAPSQISTPQLPRPITESLTAARKNLQISFLGATQADHQLAASIAGLLKAWQTALPELPTETWDLWQQHWLLNYGKRNSISSNKNWRRDLQQQPWLLALVRQHTKQLFSQPHQQKALNWLAQQMS